MEYVIGISFACTSIITGLFGADGRMRGRTEIPVRAYRNEEGREEFEPEDWSEACFQALRQVVKESGINPGDVKCLAAAGHNSELVLLGKDGKPLCRSVLGRGMRYPKEDREVEAIQNLVEWSGNTVLRENMASKILWLRKHKPHLLDRVSCILYGKDWLSYRLTGNLFTDVTTAGYSQLFHPVSRQWSQEMTDYLGISSSVLPPVYESSDIIGHLTREAAEKTGLPESVVCVAGLTNKACIELASLAVDEGDDIYTLNLSGNIITHSSRPVTDPEHRIRLFCSGIRGEYMLLADTKAAFSSFLWYGKTFHPNRYRVEDGKSRKALDALEKIAAGAPAGAGGVYFLPYIKGEEIPVNDPLAKGMFIGMSDQTTAADALRAVTEGIGYSTLDCMNFVHHASGIPNNGLRFRAMGNPDYWMQLMADQTGRTVSFIEPSNGSITGASVIAAAGAGIYPDARQASKSMIPEGKVYEPDRQKHIVYAGNYEIYRDLYPAVRHLFGKI